MRLDRLLQSVIYIDCLLLACTGIAQAGTPAAARSDDLRRHIEAARQQPALLDTRITLILEADPSTALTAQIAAHHGTQRYRHRRLHEIEIPLGRLAMLLDALPGDVVARLPYPHEALAVTGQGVALTGAADMHGLQNSGQGVSIGIIDLGFANLSAAQASGDLPSNLTITDYTGTGVTTGTTHGTSVAEIAHEMAPGATLYLAKVATDVQLAQAASDMAAAGVRVINHSVAWFGAAFYDGTGPICDVVNTAATDGVQWVNAMGNSRTKHYLGTFTDSDGDLRHEFTSNQNYNTITVTAKSALSLILNWDAYPTTTIDYDLYLYNGNPDSGGTLVASSVNAQSGRGQLRYPYPYEAITHTPTTTGTYYIVARKVSASTAHLPLTLFSTGPDLAIYTPASSMAQPADCANTLSVGAVNLSDVAEYFSSEGPTTDNRAKPDITAPDRVQTSLASSFAGTSASSPHMAGAVALVMAHNPAYTLPQIRSLLIGTAKDVYSAGYDYRTGYGRVSLDADRDGVNHDMDNCRLAANADQADMDTDGAGDACDDDIDGDNLSNTVEARLGSDPRNTDTDGDGLGDGTEVNVHQTSPISPDTDGDGLTDGSEINNYGTNPRVSDKGDLAPLGAADGQTNIADLLILSRFAEGLDTPSGRDFILADMNADNQLDVRDLLLLRRQLGY